MELLELTYQADTKLISEDVFELKPFKHPVINTKSQDTILEIELSPIRVRQKEKKEFVQSKNHLTSPLPLETSSEPLTPAYHPNRKVSLVWSENHRVEDLYRYTNFDRLVYPPGYVRESDRG